MQKFAEQIATKIKATARDCGNHRAKIATLSRDEAAAFEKGDNQTRANLRKDRQAVARELRKSLDDIGKDLTTHKHVLSQHEKAAEGHLSMINVEAFDASHRVTGIKGLTHLPPDQRASWVKSYTDRITNSREKAALTASAMRSDAVDLDVMMRRLRARAKETVALMCMAEVAAQCGHDRQNAAFQRQRSIYRQAAQDRKNIDGGATE